MAEKLTIEETIDLLDFGISIRESVLVSLDGFQVGDLSAHVSTIKNGIDAVAGISRVPLELADLDDEEALIIKGKLEKILGFEVGDDWVAIGQTAIKFLLGLLSK